MFDNSCNLLCVCCSKLSLRTTLSRRIKSKKVAGELMSGGTKGDVERKFTAQVKSTQLYISNLFSRILSGRGTRLWDLAMPRNDSAPQVLDRGSWGEAGTSARRANDLTLTLPSCGWSLLRRFLSALALWPNFPSYATNSYTPLGPGHAQE